MSKCIGLLPLLGACLWSSENDELRADLDTLDTRVQHLDQESSRQADIDAAIDALRVDSAVDATHQAQLDELSQAPVSEVLLLQGGPLVMAHSSWTALPFTGPACGAMGGLSGWNPPVDGRFLVIASVQVQFASPAAGTWAELGLFTGPGGGIYLSDFNRQTGSVRMYLPSDAGTGPAFRMTSTTIADLTTTDCVVVAAVQDSGGNSTTISDGDEEALVVIHQLGTL